jgi:hypothetical protein
MDERFSSSYYTILVEGSNILRFNMASSSSGTRILYSKSLVKVLYKKEIKIEISSIDMYIKLTLMQVAYFTVRFFFQARLAFIFLDFHTILSNPCLFLYFF